MELGNMMFGNSRGEYHIKRSAGWEEELTRLFEAYAPERYHSFRDYGEEFENEVFSVFPYYWGDCTCGYEERWEEKEAAWSKQNQHAPDCYQTELTERTQEYDAASGYTRIRVAAFGGDDSLLAGFDTQSEPISIGGAEVGVSMMMTPRKDAAMEEWRTANKRRNAFRDSLYKELCAKYKQSEYGCAVHCTCGHDERYAAFAATDSHDPRCPIVRPNFHYKPTGFEINWYKYPLRDSYKNQNVGLSDFGKMIDVCIASLNCGAGNAQLGHTDNTLE